VNRKLLAEAALLANTLDRAIIANCFTFDVDRTLLDSMVADSLFIVDRETGEKIKIWEQAYDG